jgi:hypothetical protein
MSNEKPLCFINEYNIESILSLEEDVFGWIESENFPIDNNGFVKGGFIVKVEFIEKES